MNKDVISPRTFVSVSCWQFWFNLDATAEFTHQQMHFLFKKHIKM